MPKFRNHTFIGMGASPYKFKNIEFHEKFKLGETFSLVKIFL